MNSPSKGGPDLGPLFRGYPQNGASKWGPNPMSNLRVQTAVNVILPILPVRGTPKKGVQNPHFGTPFWGPNRGSNWRVQTAVNVILPISPVAGGPQNGPQNGVFWGPF
jgi:hypothetical protein